MRTTFRLAGFAALALVAVGSLPAIQITGAEYYFNTDPGLGQATPVAVAPGQTEVDLAFTVPGSAIAELEPGLHRVWMRVRDENGQWSESLARTFRIDGPGPAPEPAPLPVARIDYRWHLDGAPVGAAVSLAPDAPATTIAFDRLAGLAGLQEGLTYQLVATPYDALGTAGFSVTKSIKIETTDTDGDGLPDLWETNGSLNPNSAGDAALDIDGDGLSNLQEFALGTRPNQRDTSGDGLGDGFVFALGLDPATPHPGLRASLLALAGDELGLVSEAQLRALAPDRPLLARDPVTGKFTLSVGLLQSTDLNDDWSPLPFTTEQTEVADGRIEHTFEAPGPVHFYRVILRE